MLLKASRRFKLITFSQFIFLLTSSTRPATPVLSNSSSLFKENENEQKGQKRYKTRTWWECLRRSKREKWHKIYFLCGLFFLSLLLVFLSPSLPVKKLKSLFQILKPVCPIYAYLLPSFLLPRLSLPSFPPSCSLLFVSSTVIFNQTYTLAHFEDFLSNFDILFRRIYRHEPYLVLHLSAPDNGNPTSVLTICRNSLWEPSPSVFLSSVAFLEFLRLCWGKRGRWLWEIIICLYNTLFTERKGILSAQNLISFSCLRCFWNWIEVNTVYPFGDNGFVPQKVKHDK